MEQAMQESHLELSLLVSVTYLSIDPFLTRVERSPGLSAPEADWAQKVQTQAPDY